MITYFTNQDAFYFDIETNCIVMVDVHFYANSYLFNGVNCIINNGNLLSDGEKREEVYIKKIQ